MKRFSRNQKIRVYYNNVTLGNKETPHVVHMNCPFIDIPWRQATEEAEKKISSGEWSVYLIPELNSLQVYYAGVDSSQEDEENTIQCPNGCAQETLNEEDYEDVGMFTPVFLNGLSSPPDYICNACEADAEIV